MKPHIACAIFLSMTMTAAPVIAATVTLGFDGITDYGGAHGPTLSTEAGVTIELSDGFDLEGEPALSSGVVHLDDSGTGYSKWVELRFPDPVRVHALDINGLGLDSWYYPENGWFDDRIYFSYDNVLIEGGGLGGEVSTSFATGADLGWQTWTLGTAFSALDWLRITALMPDEREASPFPDWDCSFPCGHFEVDNVSFTPMSELALSPVPLPGSLPALGAGLGLLVLIRRRRVQARRR